MEDVEQISSIVARHTLPSFVRDFTIKLGEFDGDPAVWIVFRTMPLEGMDGAAMMDRGKALSRFKREVLIDLMEHSIGPYPFFRFDDASEGDRPH